MKIILKNGTGKISNYFFFQTFKSTKKGLNCKNEIWVKLDLDRTYRVGAQIRIYMGSNQGRFGFDLANI